MATMSLPMEDVLPEPDAAKHAYQVLADGASVLHGDFAEEVDYIVVGRAGDVDISEKDDDVAIHFPFCIDAAKEADGRHEWKRCDRHGYWSRIERCHGRRGQVARWLQRGRPEGRSATFAWS